jgi:nicotinamide riboside kinase
MRHVAIIGAECTGKTELCLALAKAMRGGFVAEYLREFCSTMGRTPNVIEQSAICAEQVSRERNAIELAAETSLKWLFFDSTPFVTAAYSLFFFHDRSLLQAALIHQKQYDTTLLADSDLPWISDGFMRDGPEVRDQFQNLLSTLLVEHQVPHARVSGFGRNRLAMAQSALQIGSDVRLQSINR